MRQLGVSKFQQQEMMMIYRLIALAIFRSRFNGPIKWQNNNHRPLNKATSDVFANPMRNSSVW